MAFTIFITAPQLAPAGLRILEGAGCRVLFMRDGSSAAEVEQTLASEPVDAVISRTVELSAAAIRSCPTLKVISKHGVGVPNIDVAAATERYIPVYVTPGANAQSVAELTLGLMLAAARKVAALDAELRAGRWTRAQDGVQLAGRRLGLVGFGQVGQRVAKVALALGMEVEAFDPGLRGPSPVEGVALHESLETLLPRSDVLSLHIPLNARTRGLIDAARLALLPRGAMLVNTARGEVIDEPALVQALGSGALFSAGLDTMAVEPLPPSSALIALPNVVLTPHVGGSTAAALEGMATGAARNVLGFLTGRAPDLSACVNPQVFSQHNQSI
ncbi:hydroxyacid dehydrogenase [Pantoea sp. 18069]|uniref:hydroxyacid dehydrogenase n=1 Tax=Pantoea sp. 18069 TaxID=2681415 RepID=UPI00135697EF|nr:hydroxyacid dehydrogenase [Pantoea sp. 18069]